MNLQLLRTLLAVAEHGSFKQAAAMLNFTPPAVSQQMRRLEAELGVALFERRATGVALTHAGEQLLPFAARIEEEMSNAKRALRESAADAEHVRIAASPSMARYVLPWLLDDALRRHRFGLTTVVTDNHRIVLAEEREVDFCICHSSLVSRKLESRHLLSARLVMIGRPDHYLSGKRRVSAQEVAAETLISVESRTPIARLVHDWAAAQGVDLRASLEIDSFDAVKDAVARGSGIAVVSEVSSAKEVRAGDLSVIPVIGFPLAYSQSIAWHRGAEHSRGALALLEAVETGEWTDRVPGLRHEMA